MPRLRGDGRTVGLISRSPNPRPKITSPGAEGISAEAAQYFTREYNAMVDEIECLSAALVLAGVEPAAALARDGEGQPDIFYGDTVFLSRSDPFDRALIKIVEMNRKKRKDYAHDGDDPFTNFRVTSELMGLEGFGAVESALFNILQKVARLQSLRKNGRFDAPTNESVEDTFLDLAVYGNIAYALYLERRES